MALKHYVQEIWDLETPSSEHSSESCQTKVQKWTTDKVWHYKLHKNLIGIYSALQKDELGISVTSSQLAERRLKEALP